MTGLESALAVARNSLRIQPAHFVRTMPRARAIALFRESVELIEIETTSYCNRTCAFCPNSIIDRRSERNAMPEKTWDAILAGMREVEYDGTLVWSRYSEPMSEGRRLLERLDEARAAAPRARIGMNSNGDYLTAAMLGDLADRGVARLWVDVYLPDDERYSATLAREYLDKFLNRVKKSARIHSHQPELRATLEYKRIEVEIHCRNLDSMRKLDMSDRGGLVTIARTTVRSAPCYTTYKHLVIDWDGSVVPCCQLRSDTPQHAGLVTGQVGSDFGLVDAYLSLAAWREGLRNFGRKSGPCATCNVSEYSGSGLNLLVSRALSSDSYAASALKWMMRPVAGRRQRF